MIKTEILPIYPSLKTTKNVGLGDLTSLPPDMRTQVLNDVASRAFRERTVLDDLRIQAETQRLRSELDEFRIYVQNPNNYPPNASGTIKSLYQEADNKSLESNMETRVAARLTQFEKLHIVMDYDGTITDHKKPLEGLSEFTSSDPRDHLTTLIPLSTIAEPMLKKNGRDNFPEVFSASWQYFLQDERGRQVFRLNGSYVPIREGVDRFFGFAKEDLDAKLTIVSANFEPFVMGGLDKIPKAENISVFAVTENSIIPTAKGDLLTHLAQADPSKAVIYIGDGASDLPTIQARNLVASYFALDGSEFAKSLEHEDLPYFSYRNFLDIRLKLQKINNINNRNASWVL